MCPIFADFTWFLTGWLMFWVFSDLFWPEVSSETKDLGGWWYLACRCRFGPPQWWPKWSSRPHSAPSWFCLKPKSQITPSTAYTCPYGVCLLWAQSSGSWCWRSGRSRAKGGWERCPWSFWLCGRSGTQTRFRTVWYISWTCWGLASSTFASSSRRTRLPAASSCEGSRKPPAVSSKPYTSSASASPLTKVSRLANYESALPSCSSRAWSTPRFCFACSAGVNGKKWLHLWGQSRNLSLIRLVFSIFWSSLSGIWGSGRFLRTEVASSPGLDSPGFGYILQFGPAVFIGWTDECYLGRLRLRWWGRLLRLDS